ncbi:hypothetical protein BKA70DRAFT_453960 [Coprinopsis sp. MPI-PUGE-AT-0042]|nr:hypothetical protein BKA70DRAFT_453960 [Coprinopsis sp. MPI-PUGE-AT-0042]
MSQIPFEIIHMILCDHLHGDFKTAKSISLVCHYWQDLGQRIAFRRLKILVSAGCDTAPLITRLNGLASHPRLLAHVTEFDLELQGGGIECAQWMTLNAHLLIDILDLIQLGQPLRVLSIHGRWTSDHFKRFIEGSPEGAEMLRKLYRTAANPTVHTLDLVCLPTTVLHHHLPGLKHLTIRYLFPYGASQFGMVTDAPRGGAAPSSRAVLETLNVQCVESRGYESDHDLGAFDYLASASNTNTLLCSVRELNVRCSLQNQWECARKIMDKCRSSLKILTVKCYRTPPLQSLPDLALLALPNLQKLSVVISPRALGNPQAASRSPIAWLQSEIRADSPFAETDSKLEHVRILIVLGWEHALDRAESQLFTRTSEALASQEKFPLLKSVEVVLCIWRRLSGGFSRDRNRVRTYNGCEKVLNTYRKDTEALAQRGPAFFQLRWEHHDQSPWDWC